MQPPGPGGRTPGRDEGIATDDHAAVTCRKCLGLLYKLDREEAAPQPVLMKRPIQGVVGRCNGHVSVSAVRGTTARLNLSLSSSRRSRRSIPRLPYLAPETGLPDLARDH